jgi:protein TonB
VLRLLLTPALVVVLFAGGVYWVKLQLPASRTGQDEISTIQVHLLPRPAPAPIPVAESSQPTTASVAARADVSVDRPDRPTENVTTTPMTPDLPPRKASTPTDRPAPSLADAPPNAAAIRFQQVLLQHVARYQRYPKAARKARLYGSVGTIFSMRRDGAVLGVWITSSSGQKIFDREAVDTIWRAQPMPSIPPGLPDPLTVQTTLVFEPG